MAESQDCGQSRKSPAAFRVFTIVFVAASNYFAAAPIFAQFGNFVGYSFCAAGVVLIVKLSEAIGRPEGDEHARVNRPCRPPPYRPPNRLAAERRANHDTK